MSSRVLAPMLLLVVIALYGLLATLRANDQSKTDVNQVRLVVTVSQNPPYAGQIYLAGSINDWQPGRLAIPHVGNGIYAHTVSWPLGQGAQYKFTRTTSWDTVEKAYDGSEIDNRELNLKKSPSAAVAYHHIARWADQEKPIPTQLFGTGEGKAASGKTTTGDVRHLGALPAPQLDGKREVMVYLPPGYDESAERYPVVYMLDGQNVFDATTSYIGIEWSVDETAEAAIKSGRIPACIVVAIYNSPQRMDEYTPFPDEQYGGGGHAEKFMAFVTETVKPYVDNKFRTRPEREHTTFGGSSLGGLLSIYAGMEHHDTFQRIAVYAPSLQWADYRILRELKKTELPPDMHFWIEVGIGDSTWDVVKQTIGVEKPKLGKYHSACRELAEILRSKGIDSDSQLHYAEHKGDFHNEAEWAARVLPMMEFLIAE